MPKFVYSNDAEPRNYNAYGLVAPGHVVDADEAPDFRWEQTADDAKVGPVEVPETEDEPVDHTPPVDPPVSLTADVPTVTEPPAPAAEPTPADPAA